MGGKITNDAASNAQMLVEGWTFKPSYPTFRTRIRRMESEIRFRRRRPEFLELKAVYPEQRWAVYFVFSPSGTLSRSQEFTLRALRKYGLPVLAIIATADASLVPSVARELTDALYWKDLNGYDFSAYTLALEKISVHSPGADVFVMNDSVFGPFCDVSGVFESPWRFTGWTASASVENHIQSYAFSLKQVDITCINSLRSVLFRSFSFNRPQDVIACQETRLARVASRSMTVGSLWYSPRCDGYDPTLQAPFDLLRLGYPFVKKSLLGKHKDFQNQEEVKDWLQKRSHPFGAD